MRDVLVKSAIARHRPTDGYRRAGPVVQDKIMALCVATQSFAPAAEHDGEKFPFGIAVRGRNPTEGIVGIHPIGRYWVALSQRGRIKRWDQIR